MRDDSVTVWYDSVKKIIVNHKNQRNQRFRQNNHCNYSLTNFTDFPSTVRKYTPLSKSEISITVIVPAPL